MLPEGQHSVDSFEFEHKKSEERICIGSVQEIRSLMDINDKCRAWYDARDYGPLSKSHPYQSAVCTASSLPARKHGVALEEHLMRFCGTVQKKHKLSLSRAELTRMINGNEAPSSSWGLVERRASLSDGVALADDLYASNEALSKRMIAAQNQEIEQFKAELTRTMEEERRQQHWAAEATRVVPDTTAASTVSTNKFRTAKDQFSAEGGQLKETSSSGQVGIKRAFSSTTGGSRTGNGTKEKEDLPPLPPELEGYDRELVEKIIADIIDNGQPVTFKDISGLDFAKKCVTELICWPMTRPDLFSGLRALPRGLLLFGPPGTGKTLIGKAIAHQSGATFFSISASSLMSKWIGEGEKTVRTLFAVAAHRQPSVVFIDEVDSLLCQRSSDENEATRRIKTEFMVQLDGAGTSQTARVVIVGATNRPEELDEAVRRRFVKRIYIPLPDEASRRQLLTMLLGQVRHSLEGDSFEDLVGRTDGYSGADIRALCQEAAMGPVREVAQLSSGDLQSIDAQSMPPVSLAHFADAFEAVLPSVSGKDLHRYIEWNNEFGSFRRMS